MQTEKLLQGSRLTALPKRGMSPFRAFLRSPALRDSLALMAVSTVARGMSALGAVAVAYTAGAGEAMDLYMAFTLATVSFCLLVSVALPSIASSVIANGAVASEAARSKVTGWAAQLSRRGTLVYLLLLPVMAWLFTPETGPTPASLAVLLLIGTGSVWLSPRLAGVQTLLQGLGAGKRATAYSAVCTAVMLGACLVTAATGSVVWAALGMPIGASLEYLLLKRLLRKLTVDQQSPEAAVHVKADIGPEPSAGLPWKAYAIFTAASLSAFAIGLIDQGLLARIGDNAQATWGLAGRPASFLATTLFAVVSVFGTRLAVKSDLENIPVFRRQTLKLAAFATAAMAGLLLVLVLVDVPMMRVLYERGVFTPQDTLRTAQALSLAVWTYVLYPASIVLVRAVSTLHAYRPLLLSTAAFLAAKLGLGTSLLSWGLWGVTLSTFAAMAVQVLILYLALGKLSAASQNKKACSVEQAL